jgi:hypothetical protein
LGSVRRRRLTRLCGTLRPSSGRQAPIRVRRIFFSSGCISSVDRGPFSRVSP